MINKSLAALALALACCSVVSANPSPFTASDLAQRTVERRAVEAAIWGMPLVNFDAMRQAYFRDAGARYNDIIYWSRPSDALNQVTTPNNSTSYVMFFANLKNGPVVVDVPPARDLSLYGTLIDAWTVPVLDVGSEGADKGAGGKYLLLPPDFSGEAPAGYIPVRMKTFNVYSLLRLITKTGSDEDQQKAVAYLHGLRIYPLTQQAVPPDTQYIDLVGKPFNGIAAHDASFYDSLARMVAEEPVQEKDLAIMGQLRSLNIGKGLTFRRDAANQALLEQGIAEAHAFMMDGFARAGFNWWPTRQWRFLVDKDVIQTKVTFLVPNRFVLLDERAATWFAAFGPIAEPKAANLYLKTYVDDRGESLDGARTYRLHVPANVPASQFWSLVAYDCDTAGFIRQAPVVGLDSYNQKMLRNADGSIDVYFGPKPPAGMEANWIYTAPTKPWFVLFRIYGPQKPAVDRSWVLGDLERVPPAAP